jgi:hypothetical protein
MSVATRAVCGKEIPVIRLLCSPTLADFREPTAFVCSINRLPRPRCGCHLCWEFRITATYQPGKAGFEAPFTSHDQ